MFEKSILILITSMILFGVAMIAMPIPVVWGMLCLIFLALSVVLRNQPQG